MPTLHQKTLTGLLLCCILFLTYFRGELPDIFVPVYSTNDDNTADFLIWEIHYPPDIQANPKYLATESEE